MYNCIYILLICVVTVNATLEVTNFFTNYKPSLLLRTFSEMKGHIREVENFDEITANDLLRHGVIRVKSTGSIITSEELAENVITKNYFPSLLKKQKTKHNIFYEVNFQNMACDKETSDWVPLGPCHYNHASAKTSYSQGWSVGFTGGVSSYVTLSSILGINPKLEYDTSYSSSTSGTLSCDVTSGKTLQFQIKTENLYISNVKQRMIKVSRDYLYTFGIFATMEVGDWEGIDDFTVLNKRKIETACVTNNEFLKCEEWDYNYDYDNI